MIHIREQLDEVREVCRKMVTKRATLSAGASVIPLPSLDWYRCVDSPCAAAGD